MTTTINPAQLSAFGCDTNTLQRLFLFCAVNKAGEAQIRANGLARLLANHPDMLPFDAVRAMIADGTLFDRIVESKIGLWHSTLRQYTEIIERVDAGMDIATVERQEIATIYGFRLKTASLFILNSRPDVKMCCYDTHIGKYFRNDLGYADAPLATPADKQYLQVWEPVFIKHCEDLGLSCAHVDLHIAWAKYARTKKT